MLDSAIELLKEIARGEHEDDEMQVATDYLCDRNIEILDEDEN